MSSLKKSGYVFLIFLLLLTFSLVYIVDRQGSLVVNAPFLTAVQQQIPGSALDWMTRVSQRKTRETCGNWFKLARRASSRQFNIAIATKASAVKKFCRV